MKSIAILVLLVAGITAVAADKEANPSKVSAQVRYNQKIKVRPVGVSIEQHGKDLRERGLNPEKLDREQVAFYVDRPLAPEEVKAYAERDINISIDNWVPPVPGRHAHGFYLAEVPYGRLDELEADGRVVRIASTEMQSQPQDDVARAMTQVAAVHAGLGLNMPRTGTGVRIAIADSALDLRHPDFTNNPPFETYDMTTGTGTNNWSTNVTVGQRFHGTHVSGIIMASGMHSQDRYRGIAPGAAWAFYKIGNDESFASEADIVEAINRAVAANCKIVNLSYGTLGGHLDGSGPMEQAVDAAVAAGVTVFVAAGNAGAAGLHHSVALPSATTSGVFRLMVTNQGTPPGNVLLQLLWRGGDLTNITLACTNLGAGESLTGLLAETSPRGTHKVWYQLTSTAGANPGNTYALMFQNAAASGPTPLVHCYALPLTATVTVRFTNADPSYTILSPAVADGAIAVGALAHRAAWRACNNLVYTANHLTEGQIAGFSSRGPRIDGLQKPDVTAPGAYTISTAPVTGPIDPSLQISDDGPLGCIYATSQGTSMASPHAAGMAALILQAQPGLSPADLRTLLTTTTTNAASHDTIRGWGLLNASNAVHFAEDNLPGVWVNYAHAGAEEGNFARPFNTVIEAVANAPSAPPVIIPRIRITAGNRTESIRITSGVRIESFGGTARFGTP